jgi:hypothetical protein
VSLRLGWQHLDDEQLLDVRLCDLSLSIERTVMEQRVKRLHQELAEHGIRFKPHVWYAEEWFSPDAVPGIAIPFYLAHSRLMKLERKKMLEVEGGTDIECMRILRHEAGHALDTAFRLHSGVDGASSSVLLPGHIPTPTSPRPTAAAMSCTLMPGMPKLILRKISPRPSQYG